MPPNNDYPSSWTDDAWNPYYWGNQPPIGDAFECNNSSQIVRPLDSTYRTGTGPALARTPFCYDVDDASALSDNDKRDAPQASQKVEYDHRIATRVIEAMKHASSAGKRFFVAAGIRRPHTDWRVPHSFWAQYEHADLRLAKHQSIGKNISSLAFEMNGVTGEVFTRQSDKTAHRESPGGPGLPADLQRDLRRGYYAAVSFMDFEVGRILNGLKALGLEQHTAVLFHSDHGWKLGEHGDWSKCANWELDTRVPLIIKAPWIRPSIGARTSAFAELVDIYPTLVELSGLDTGLLEEGLEGTSLVPALNHPGLPTPHNKTAAFSQFPRCTQYVMEQDPASWQCVPVPRANITRMGYSVRVADARYTEWRVWNNCSADWSSRGVVAKELYDHTGDTGLGPDSFDEYEFENLAYQPARQQQVSELQGMLVKQFGSSAAGC